VLRPVIQREATGCGIASVAALAGVSYAQAKAVAGSLNIFASDARLWSQTAHVQNLLRHFGLKAAAEKPFRSWEALPDRALLATKWHMEKGLPFWHWVVFVRDEGGTRVLDSKRSLRTHSRTDFGRIRPKWYIPIDGPFSRAKTARGGPATRPATKHGVKSRRVG
jgi:hypothetical protein